jgi:hypothetical protein
MMIEKGPHMPTFEARMRVVHQETWTVEAADEADARKKLMAIADDVETDDAGGEVVGWEIQSIKPAR